VATTPGREETAILVTAGWVETGTIVFATPTEAGLRATADTVPVTSRHASRTAARSFIEGISCD
jgi:hypothetical protein